MKTVKNPWSPQLISEKFRGTNCAWYQPYMPGLSQSLQQLKIVFSKVQIKVFLLSQQANFILFLFLFLAQKCILWNTILCSYVLIKSHKLICFLPSPYLTFSIKCWASRNVYFVIDIQFNTYKKKKKLWVKIFTIKTPSC